MRKQLAYLKLAKAVKERGATVYVLPGPDDERVGLWVDGRHVQNMVLVRQEMRAGRGTSGRFRLVVGPLGERKSFPQKRDGTFSWDKAAKHLLLLLKTRGEDMTDAKRVERLDEIRGEISDLVDEAEKLVRGTGVYGHAKAYWLAWLRNMLDGDPSCMRGDIDTLRKELG